MGVGLLKKMGGHPASRYAYRGLRGVVSYQYAAMEQKLFPYGPVKAARRFYERSAEVLKFACLPLVLGIGLYTWGNWSNEQMHRSHWYGGGDMQHFNNHDEE